jgi:hypothetical protein
MKARPILMSGPMVQAILAGRKTQTRRVLKPQPGQGLLGPRSEDGRWMIGGAISQVLGRCPYGQPGDLLWVRETHYVAEGMRVIYRADDPDASVRWTPSIYTPRWASRLTLHITDASVERVQDISEEEAEAEGAPLWIQDAIPGVTHAKPKGYRPGFAELWDSINAKRGYSWAMNPWVWVIEFVAIQRNVDEVRA